jgi:hypothetical protein
VSSHSLTVVAYAALALALVATEILAHRRPDAVASVSGMVRRVCRTRAGQLCLVLAWWWLGWHFLLND